MDLNRDELLRCCRYYKGEKANPFTSGVPSFLWQTERDWVEREVADAKTETLSEKSAEIMDEYRAAGLLDFEKSDGVWIGLKAALYRLLQHWNEGVASSGDWVRFYKDWKNATL